MTTQTIQLLASAIGPHSFEVEVRNAPANTLYFTVMWTIHELFPASHYHSPCVTRADDGKIRVEIDTLEMTPVFADDLLFQIRYRWADVHGVADAAAIELITEGL